MAVTKNTDKMAALMGAAIALPGIGLQASDAGVRADNYNVSYHHASYTESGSRMEIEADQLSFSAPLADRFEVKLNLIKDVTSGASPEFYVQGADMQPVQVLQSGASIKDEREVIDFSLGYYGDNQIISANVGSSKEDDYKASFFSMDYSRHYNDKTTTLILGMAHSADDVWRADVPGFNVNQREKTDLIVGVSQILDKNSTLQLSLTQANSSGSLSDPYKRAYIGDLAADLPESRPDKRGQTLIAARYSRFLAFNDSAVHADFRYAFDEWGANSALMEVKWNNKFGEDWMISPSLRYYSQSNADFYDLYFNSVPTNGHYSTDYRLAGFGAISTKVQASRALSETVDFSITFEHYTRQYAFGLDGDSTGHKVDDFKMNLISLWFNVDI